MTDAVLLAVLGSEVVLVTEATFARPVPTKAGSTLVTIVTGTVVPVATVPSWQVTVPVELVQVPWGALAETKLTALGRVSDTETPWAGLGPALATLSV